LAFGIVSAVVEPDIGFENHADKREIFSYHLKLFYVKRFYGKVGSR